MFDFKTSSRALDILRPLLKSNLKNTHTEAEMNALEVAILNGIELYGKSVTIFDNTEEPNAYDDGKYDGFIQGLVYMTAETGITFRKIIENSYYKLKRELEDNED